MDKKSMFYTMAAISLTIVIIATYAFYTGRVYTEKMESTQTRIETVNFFIKNIEKDLEKGAFIAGFRTILSFNQYITSNGSYVKNVDARFKEAFLNGTIDRQPLSLMAGSTFTDWVNKIEVEANAVDIFFNISIIDVKLYQSDPWSVDIGINFSLDIDDKKNTSRWEQNKYSVIKISILGFEDPLYVINSNGRVTNQIVKSNITDFIVYGNVSNLLTHLNSSYYIAHNDSPNFLMRLQGNVSNSTFGIESLVNLEDFQQQGISLKDRSIVDYIYFGAQTTTDYRVNGTPFWFKMDSGHLSTYQITMNMTS